MALPFLETYITYEAVLKLLIHYRCKEAERIQRILVVDDLAVKAKSNPTDIRDEELYAMFPPRRKWIHVDYENRKNYRKGSQNFVLIPKVGSEYRNFNADCIIYMNAREYVGWCICLIKESYRLNEERFLPGYDLVYIARVSSKDKSYREIEKSLLHVSGKMKILGEADS